MANTDISQNLKAKMAKVEEVKGTWGKAASVVVLGFRFMNVMAVTDLRDRFRKAGVEYKVYKNSVIAQALKGTPLESSDVLNGALRGETGVAFSFEDPSVAAKIVKEFRKDEKNEKLEVKCAVLDGSVMTGKEVEGTLATMPGKDELRAMLLATLQAPAQQLVRLLQAPSQNLVYAFEAKRKLEAGES